MCWPKWQVLPSFLPVSLLFNTATITTNPVNDPRHAMGDSFTTYRGDTASGLDSGALSLLAHDWDLEDSVFYPENHRPDHRDPGRCSWTASRTIIQKGVFQLSG